MENQQPSINYIMNKKPKKEYGFIYCYTSPSGKKYIGQTTRSLSERASDNGKDYKKCVKFYEAILKYGFKNFTVEILEEAPIELLDVKEKEWIAFFNTQSPNGYNVDEGGGGHSKKVYQYDRITGLFLKEYPSLAEAAKQNGIKNIQPISDCLHGRTKCAHNFIWRLFKVEKVDPQDYFSNEPKKIYVYNLDGTFFKEFPSITAAAKETGAGRCDIRRVIKGQLHYVKDKIFRCEYTDLVEPVPKSNRAKPIAQIDLETQQIINIYESASAAARAY